MREEISRVELCFCDVEPSWKWLRRRRLAVEAMETRSSSISSDATLLKFLSAPLRPTSRSLPAALDEFSGALLLDSAMLP